MIPSLCAAILTRLFTGLYSWDIYVCITHH